MAQMIEAICDGAVFRPQNPAELPANGRYKLTFEPVVAAAPPLVVNQTTPGTPAGKFDIRDLGPITRSATGLAKAPADMSDRELLESALLEKYGLSA